MVGPSSILDILLLNVPALTRDLRRKIGMGEWNSLAEVQSTSLI